MSLADVFRTLDERNQTVHKADFFCRAKPTVEVVKPLALDRPMYPSGISNFCPREEVLRSVLRINRVKKATLKEEIQKARGTAMHRLLQNEILPSMDAIDGFWRCNRCGWKTGFIRKPSECPQCKASVRHLLYEEVHLESDALGLSGNCDGVWWEDRSLYEIKTCAIGTYSRVIAAGPMLSHKVQAGAYLRMWWGETGVGFTQLDSIRFLYVPMDDVSDVKIPAPANRKVPFEYDYETGMIVFKTPGDDVIGPFNKAMAAVQEFRVALVDIGNDGRKLPCRNEACKSEENAGRWKYGCVTVGPCFKCDDQLPPLGHLDELQG